MQSEKQDHEAQSVDLIRVTVAEMPDEDISAQVTIWPAALAIKRSDGKVEMHEWGVVMADIVRYLANGAQQELGKPEAETINEVVETMLRELRAPATDATVHVVGDPMH